LDRLAEELEVLKSAGKNSENVDPPSCAVAAVFSILLEKNGNRTAKIEFETFMEKLSDYRIEIGLETVHRRTDLSYNPATIETIFSNRSVKTWRKPD